jgi:hypothetical protein
VKSPGSSQEGDASQAEEKQECIAETEKHSIPIWVDDPIED